MARRTANRRRLRGVVRRSRANAGLGFAVASVADEITWTTIPQTWTGAAAYVDSDNGNDGTGALDFSGAPNATPNAYLTVDAAVTALENNRGGNFATKREDRLFLLAGTTNDYDVIKGGSSKWRINGGPTPSTPLVMTSYGASAVRPRIIVNTGQRGLKFNLGGGATSPYENIVVVGLEFWGGAGFTGVEDVYGIEILDRDVNYLIIEDCVFRNLRQGFNIIPTASYTHTDVRIRACQVYDCTRDSAHTSGIYWDSGTNGLIEWCFLHNNGTGSNTSHNIYKTGDLQSGYIGRYNVTAEPNGGDGHKYRAGGQSRYELFLKCTIGLTWGDGTPFSPSPVVLDASHGVMLDTQPLPQGPVDHGWAIRTAQNTAAGGPTVIQDMIFAHNTSHRNTNGIAYLSAPDATVAGVHDVEFYDCIWNDWGGSIRLEGSAGSGAGTFWDNFKFTRNKIVNSVDTLRPLVEIVGAGQEAGFAEFNDNAIWWNAAESGVCVNGGVNRTVAQFVSDLGIGTGNTFADSRSGWTDPNRTIATYMTSVGETATLAAFVAKCKGQGRPDLGRTWDRKWTAPVVIEYIRAGYGLAYA